MQKMGRRFFKRPRPHMFIHLLRLLCKVSGDIVASGQSFILLAWGTVGKASESFRLWKALVIWNMANFRKEWDVYLMSQKTAKPVAQRISIACCNASCNFVWGTMWDGNYGNSTILPWLYDNFHWPSFTEFKPSPKTSITVLWVPLVPAKCLPLCRVSTEAHFAGELRASKHHKRQSIAKLSCERCRIDTTAFNAEQEGLQMTSKFLRLCTLKLSSLWIYIYILYIYCTYI